MRVFTSVSSMIILSLTTVSLISCGQSDVVDSSLLNVVKSEKVTLSPCSSVLKNGDLTWIAHFDGFYIDEGKGTITVTSVDKRNGNIKFKYIMYGDKEPTCYLDENDNRTDCDQNSDSVTYTGETNGKTVSFKSGDEKFSGSCEGNEIIGNKGIYKYILRK